MNISREVLQQKIDELKTKIGASTSQWPDYTFDSPVGDATPMLEIHGDEIHFVISERGQENERFRSKDVDAILYRLFETITSTMASDYELANRRPNEDTRRLRFAKQIELMTKLKTEWGERLRTKFDAILAEAPYDDD